MHLHNSNGHTVLMSPTDLRLQDKLLSLNIKALNSQCLPQLLTIEQYHADMQICIINDTAFMPKDCDQTAQTAENYGYKVILCNKLCGKYPSNVALNVALVGNKLLCKESAVAEEIKDYCTEHGIHIINVNQGYTKCSTLILNDNSIITADETISKAATMNGIRVLKITSGHINLEGADYGFIGGSSGRIGDTVYFFGDINTHPDGKSITDYIHSEGLNHINLCDGILKDIGGFIVLN